MKSTVGKSKATTKNMPTTGPVDGGNSTAPEKIHNDIPNVTVSMFDYSVENHLRSVDTISRLCEETVDDDIGKSEIERLSSMITFLREWRYYNYEPRVLRFAHECGSPQGKDVDEINLPQFSAATVPKEMPSRSTTSMESSKDFVFYVGGPVWALDWCPRVRQTSSCQINCEFIAVAAHPPDSSYHKMGVPLTGRGVIQIWCLLNVIKNEEEVPPTKNSKRQPSKNKALMDQSTVPKKPRGRPRKNPIRESPNNIDCDDELVQPLMDQSTVPKKPRGRPRKNPIRESPNNIDCDDELVQPLAVLFPENSFKVPVVDAVFTNTHGSDHSKYYKRKRKGFSQGMSACDSAPKTSAHTTKLKSKGKGGSSGDGIHMCLLTEMEDNGSSAVNPQTNDSSEQDLVASNILLTGESSGNGLPVVDGVFTNTHGSDHSKYYKRKRKDFSQGMSACDSAPKTFAHSTKLKSKGKRGSSGDGIHMCLLTEMEDNGSSAVNPQTNNSSEQDVVASNILLTGESSGNGLSSYPIPEDVVSPRIVLCLAHNGKVAWDAKWRPPCVYDIVCKYRMGYLAVILGNGSLEVWDVPLPSLVNVAFSYLPKDGTDPRFVKLKPVFKCSKVKCGDRESLPLTVEWSSSLPHDFILAGCHDGTVALWKFSANDLSEDTKPLLCFSADTVPIRALAWAPVENDPESANVIVTAGHGGLKFWDIRDPFRPIWDLSSLQKVIYSLDWLPDPRCIILSLDDGTLKILSLAEASYDVPVTGKPFDGSKLKGLHTYLCSSFSIWSVQASHPTGMVAYCTADGNVHHFQLTAKAVEKDPSRYRPPTFLCGSLAEEKSTLTVNTPLVNIPIPMRKFQNGSGVAPTSMRGIESKKGRLNDQKTKGQASDDRTLALCYGDDPGEECGTDKTLAVQKNTHTPKSKPRSKKNAKNDQALVCRDEEPENMQMRENVEKQIEVIPPKIVAMHKVRWNMNKGSERWLCYGGAAGIVRCQEIV